MQVYDFGGEAKAEAAAACVVGTRQGGTLVDFG